MMKVLLGRVLPIGAAVALLSSSASPIAGTLSAFGHAANALGGAQNVDTSDVTMPDEASVNAALGEAATGGFSLSKMFGSLFGPSQSDLAKSQLDTIIANVKGRSQGGQAGLTPDGQRAGGKGTAAKVPAAGKGGKAGGKATTGAKGTKGAAAGKGGTAKGPAPEPGAQPAAPPAGGGTEGQAAGGGEPAGGAP